MAHVSYNEFKAMCGDDGGPCAAVGPFVRHNTVEKKSNVTFFDNNTKVSYIGSTYNEWDYDSFCDNCTLNDTIVSFNPAYYTVVAAYKGEANFLYSLTPKAGGSLRASTRPT